MKDIKKRGLLMLVAIIVLAGIIIASSLAWYTKMVSIQSISFKLARWDFNANYQVDDLFVNVNEYTSIGYIDPVTGRQSNAQIDYPSDRYAAPGTAGTVSLLLSAENSNTDVHYSIKLDKSTMSTEFQKRIFFYYPARKTGGTINQYGVPETNGGYEWELFRYDTVQSGPEGSIPFGQSVTMNLKWEWVYDYDEYLKKTDEFQYTVAQILRAIYDSNVGRIVSDDIGVAFDIANWAHVEELRWAALADNGDTSQATYDKYVAYKKSFEAYMIRKYGANFILEAIPDYSTWSGSRNHNLLDTFISNSRSSRARTYTRGIPGQFSWQSLWKSMTSEEYSVIKAIRTLSDDVRQEWLPLETTTGLTKPSGMTDAAWEAVQSYAASHSNNPINSLWKRFTSVRDDHGNLILNYDQEGYYIILDVFDKMQTAERTLFFDDERDNGRDQITRTIGNLNVEGMSTEDKPEEVVNKYITSNNYASVQSYFNSYIEAYEEFDEFDTKVGLSPGLYSQEMRATLHLSGVQATPVNTPSSP